MRCKQEDVERLEGKLLRYLQLKEVVVDLPEPLVFLPVASWVVPWGDYASGYGAEGKWCLQSEAVILLREFFEQVRHLLKVVCTQCGFSWNSVLFPVCPMCRPPLTPAE
jgi:lipopolysaccharide biosynthesis regulator YciM